MWKSKKRRPRLIAARRTEGFFGETNWSITKYPEFSPNPVRGGLSVLSATEAERLATLPLLEPGEDAEGIGSRSLDPDFFYIEAD